MINFIVVLIGLYLSLGLILTWYVLKNETMAKDLKDFGFVTLVLIILSCIVSAPLFLMKSMHRRLKMGGETNVKKSRDEEK